MRWPWVSRVAYDELSLFYTRQIDTWRAMHAEAHRHGEAMLAQERASHNALLEKFLALRLAGGDTAQPALPAARARTEPDPVTQAIIAKAGHSLILRKHYAEYVRDERAKGTDELDIAQAIRDGHSDDEEMVFG